MSTQPTEEWIPADSLATRLFLVRRELGLTQRQAAERTGLTFGEWQSMEDGRRARGVDQKVLRISLALGVSRDWLMWGGPLAPASGVTSAQSCSPFETSTPGDELARARQRRRRDDALPWLPRPIIGREPRHLRIVARTA